MYNKRLNTENLWEMYLNKLGCDVAIACLNFGGTVTSNIRSVKHNKDVKGAPTSWHLDGLAFDVQLDQKDISVYQKFIQFLQLKGYRVLRSGSGNVGVFHIQFDWPIVLNYERKNHLSHLQALLDSGYQVETFDC